MKYKFQVVIPLTYSDTEIEVEVDLTDEEVSQIKEVIANKAESADENLLPILSDEAPKLYDKFWDAIFHPLFLELLIVFPYAPVGCVYGSRPVVISEVSNGTADGTL